jgi:hypothetical protein
MESATVACRFAAIGARMSISRWTKAPLVTMETG